MRDLVRRAHELVPKCRIPYASSGRWAVGPYFITTEMSQAYDNPGGDGVIFSRPGEHHMLSLDGSSVMTDMDWELASMVPFIEKATGRVLITGLGLGLMPTALLACGRVECVDIVEIAQDVINLVWSSIQDPRITVHHADAYEWGAGDNQWDFAWHDVTHSCDHSPEEANALRSRYKAAVQDVWRER